MLFSSCKHYEIEESKKKKKKKKRQKKKSTNSALLHDEKWASSRSCNTSTRSLETASDETITRAASNSSYFSVNSAATITSTCSLPSSLSSLGGSFRGMHLRKLSGCYECHAVVGPLSWVSRDPSLRATISPCPHCGEIFMKPESLETHQALRHAVSELGPEDTSRNIVEIIFHSSWLKKQPPVCKIEKVLKILNTSKTQAKFEDYRETIKAKANKLPKKYPRCIADGNELLRFHCTTFACSLGLNRLAGLCSFLNPKCNLCRIIRDGFTPDSLGGIPTTASSGWADEMVRKISPESERRAMLVCRVIAGRVKKSYEYDCREDCDSVVCSRVGAYSNSDELFVFNPSAILPCFVVIYSGY